MLPDDDDGGGGGDGRLRLHFVVSRQRRYANGRPVKFPTKIDNAGQRAIREAGE